MTQVWTTVAVIVLIVVIARVAWVAYKSGVQTLRHPLVLLRLCLGITNEVDPKLTLRRLRSKVKECKISMPSGVIAGASDIEFVIAEADYNALGRYVDLGEVTRDLERTYQRHLTDASIRPAGVPLSIRITPESTLLSGAIVVNYQLRKDPASADVSTEPATVFDNEEQVAPTLGTETQADTAVSAEPAFVSSGAPVTVRGHGLEFRLTPGLNDGNDALEIASSKARKLVIGNEAVFGRGADADVDLEQERVSRAQFSLRYSGREWLLLPNAAATNQLLVNGAEVVDQVALLEAKCSIQIGTKLEYSVER